MARDEFLLGSLDMAIATVRRQFYDSEARPLARRHHIRVAGPRGLSICSAKDKSCLPGIGGTTRYAQFKPTGGALSHEALLVSTMRPLGARFKFYALVKCRSTIVSE
jgi:hypothetical protein